ncbi:MAG: UDP-N-acetylmuramoyl-L-alanine--D-glutamate ligase [Phycisphaerales bacterium]
MSLTDNDDDDAEVADRRVTVMGLGRFGGGVGVTRWLADELGCRVLVTDLESPDRLRDSLEKIDDLVRSSRVTLRLGEHRPEDFSETDLVVANPAVPSPWRNRYLLAAMSAGVKVTTEMRLLVERLPDRRRVIGVTGTAGKSTTAAMIHHILRERGDAPAHLGGNIGGTLLGTEIGARDWVVIELSSAMLFWLGEGEGYEGAPGWSPGVAVVTNLAQNHIDWHGSFEHYAESKRNILRFQDADDTAVLGDLPPETAEAWTTNGRRIESIVEPLAFELATPGRHNERNARLAVTTCHAVAGVAPDDAAEALRTFRGLPHRLALVTERADGVRFYDDSKSTTPEATALAVDAFDDPSRVHLIAGGYDKGVDLSSVARLASRLAGLYTIGATGTTIASAARELCGENCFVASCDSLSKAVETALPRLRPGDALLLSPGCASWDQYLNFEERGEQFVSLVSTRAALASESSG